MKSAVATPSIAFVSLFAVASLVGSIDSVNAQDQSSLYNGLEVVQASEVEWQQRNPTRQDRGPLGPKSYVDVKVESALLISNDSNKGLHR